MSYLQFQPVALVGALILFSLVAVSMLLAPLVLGWFLRPKNPDAEKEAVYECGEPTIGPSNVQFDLRFYVVALLFIVFDVEVAFFFPWAVVFGKANTLANHNLTQTQRVQVSQALQGRADAPPVDADAAHQLMGVALVDLAVFFFVVLVGFAYVWKRGDLDWVRSVARQRALVQPQLSGAGGTISGPAATPLTV